MGIYGCVQVFIGYVRVYMGMYGYVCFLGGMYGYIWLCMSAFQAPYIPLHNHTNE